MASAARRWAVEVELCVSVCGELQCGFGVGAGAGGFDVAEASESVVEVADEVDGAHPFVGAVADDGFDDDGLDVEVGEAADIGVDVCR